MHSHYMAACQEAAKKLRNVKESRLGALGLSKFQYVGLLSEYQALQSYASCQSHIFHHILPAGSISETAGSKTCHPLSDLS